MNWEKMKIALLKNVVKKDPKDSNCMRKNGYMEMESAFVIQFNASFFLNCGVFFKMTSDLKMIQRATSANVTLWFIQQ